MDWTADGTVCVLLFPPKDKPGGCSLTIQQALQTSSKDFSVGKCGISSKLAAISKQQRKKTMMI